ncbi:hypothetical protein DACRYDRAFT_21216 [Dacryopinax primogenitus]|uniref:Secreted protein n=1 Tax=Dacryopinax primogenitus (strain DJM 731) TaxID=1858805 RepID=M5GCA5_DACPD|nr:uncharacterized protein DACRYDRAFT_21216 [Dacryopinax primogenitus]EJU03757.1 hypothetical protein DACRYDRAFT_21216 [Dacryopinax primogenitus]
MIFHQLGFFCFCFCFSFPNALLTIRHCLLTQRSPPLRLLDDLHQLPPPPFILLNQNSKQRSNPIPDLQRVPHSLNCSHTFFLSLSLSQCLLLQLSGNSRSRPPQTTSKRPPSKRMRAPPNHVPRLLQSV